MKHYSNAVEESTTDVNGAWKPLKPLQEGYEFIGDDQYDNFLTKRGKQRKELRQQGRASGLSRKEARKQARDKTPMTPRQRELAHKVFKVSLVIPRGSFIALLRLNYRGLAWKIDAVLNGTDATLKKKLTDKWFAIGGDLDKLSDAVNAGKVKKPAVCGKKCKLKLLEVKRNFTDESNYYNLTGVEETIAFLKANASVVLEVMGTILASVSVSSSKDKEIKSAERIAEQENATLSQAEKDKIALEEKKIKAEADPRNTIINDPNLTQEEKDSSLKLLDEAEGNKLNKDIIKYVVIGAIALVAIFLISKNFKKK